MKTIHLSLLLLAATLASAQPTSERSAVLSQGKKDKIQKIMDSYTQKGIPSLSLGVKTSSDEWSTASGYSQIETKSKLTAEHLMFAQSVSKTYMATAIFILKEQNKISLDSSIQAYLPKNLTSWIPQSKKITVRMLLNHTSGLHDYAYDGDYIQFLLHEQKTVISPQTILVFAMAKPSTFAPGETYEYSNTNYVLLALIADNITGDHKAFIRTAIHEKLGLKNTFYKEKNYLASPRVPNTYLDIAENGEFQNITTLQNLNVESMIGDDGHVATPLDYVRFMNSLLSGQILKKESLKEMMTFNVQHPTYGLGIAKMEQKGFTGYGHSGGGTGAGCILYHFPDKDMTIFLGTNFCTLRNGPHSLLVYQLIDELFTVLFTE